MHVQSTITTTTACRYEANVTGGIVDVPAMLYGSMDINEAMDHANTIYAYANAHAWRHKVKMKGSDHTSRMEGTLKV